MSSTLDAALDYAQRGWRVHPIKSRSKLPLLKAWQNKATTSARQIRQWFASGSANVAIATGPESGLLVLDVDGDPDELLRHFDVPDTVAQLTGGGGVQLLFRWTRDLNDCATTRAGLMPSIDTRGKGGYVVAPPSMTRKRYRWCRGLSPDDVELADPPDWLVALLSQRSTGKRVPTDEWLSIAKHGAKKGSRNSTLARLAGHLLGSGVDAEVATELLLAWSRDRCDPPMSAREAMRTIASIASKELQK